MDHPLEQFRFCPRCGHEGFAAANEKAKTCVGCGFVYYFNPSAAVACFVRNREGELLVVRRAKDPGRGTLDLPGGFVDMHETAEEAVRREVREETALCVTSLRYLFSVANVYPYAGFDVHTVDLCYEAVVDDFRHARAADDASETVILRPAELCPAHFGLTSIRQAVSQYREKHAAGAAGAE